ncbi:dUTP diphosphatase [Eupransor demetentiae]
MQHVSLGVAMKLPDGYEAIIAERSSTHKKKGVDLANGIGIIDNAYQGNDDVWCAELVANRSRVHIDRGERVLQFRIVPSMSRLVPDLQINEVEQLEGVNRGGFGSTGR